MYFGLSLRINKKHIKKIPKSYSLPYSLNSSSSLIRLPAILSRSSPNSTS
ncbi:unnamed protein product [Linum tenue]|uniref:Uncharacterized protein n=1 Tax=Linum tenue TaxID=586396 RepID=A0AAV0Q527_9ROSI|nr:unnamed protein product [Linum tenue]